MKFALKQRLRQGETLFGCFLHLGNAVAAEIMGRAGYDWALVDLEHGSGGEQEALDQMMALAGTGAASLVRVESTHRQRAHRVLDYGAEGIVFPHVDTEEEARQAVAAMRYPPEGVRGVAFSNRACGFGSDFKEYLSRAHQDLLCVVQIESPLAVENAARMAALDGVDVLFVGPTDLSQSMGMLGEFGRPEFQQAVAQVAGAARRAGKYAGLLLPKKEDVAHYWELGYRFMISGSDGVLLNLAARANVAALQAARGKLPASSAPADDTIPA